MRNLYLNCNIFYSMESEQPFFFIGNMSSNNNSTEVIELSRLFLNGPFSKILTLYFIFNTLNLCFNFILKFLGQINNNTKVFIQFFRSDFKFKFIIKPSMRTLYFYLYGDCIWQTCVFTFKSKNNFFPLQN